MRETALITGATGGLGRAMAEELARRGFDLALSARSEQRLQELGAALQKQYGVRTFSLAADLADPDAPGKIQKALENMGVQVDVLVNNAGFGAFGSFAACDWQRQRQMIQVNILALMELTRRLLPGMLRRKHGRILNVASTASFSPGPYVSAYYASKAFVFSFTQALREEMRGKGVTVTALCPGPTNTGFEKVAGLREESALVKAFPGASPRRVAQCAVRALLQGRAMAVPGLANKLLVFATRLAPRGLVLRVVGRIQKSSRGE